MSFPYTPCIPMQIKPIKACQGKGQGTLPVREWPCHPFSSTGLGSLCEFVSSQPQRCRHCLWVTTSNLHWFLQPEVMGDLSSWHWNPGLSGLVWDWDHLLLRYPCQFLSTTLGYGTTCSMSPLLRPSYPSE